MSPEQNGQDGYELDLREFPAGTHTRAFGPGHKTSFDGIGYCFCSQGRLRWRFTGRVGGDPALWPPRERVRAPVTRMSVQGGCVDVDVGVGGEGVVLGTDRELLCVGSTFGYSGHGTVETEGFVLDHED